jgi:hypothetical protein
MALSTRVIAITSGLALAGALTGALSGALAMEGAVFIFLHKLAPLQWLAPASAIGAAFGAVVAPVLAWSALRRVPLGRAIAGIALGAGLGGAIGVLIGARFVNPYSSNYYNPFVINLRPVPQGLAGGLVGAVVAAAYLRRRSSRAAITGRAG